MSEERVENVEALIAARGAPVVEQESVTESPEVKADLDATQEASTTSENTGTPRARKSAAERLHEVLEERKQDKIDREAERAKDKEKSAELEYWRQIAIKRDDLNQRQVQPSQESHEKTLEDFQYDQGAYNAYLVKQQVAAALSERDKSETERKAREKELAKLKSFEDRVEKFSTDNPEIDFSKIIGAPMDIVPINTAMAEFIHESDKGPEICVYIRDNPKEGKAMLSMSPRDVYRALAKLEARLSKEPDSAPEPPVQITRAPPAPPRLNASASTKSKEGVAAEIEAVRARNR